MVQISRRLILMKALLVAAVLMALTIGFDKSEVRAGEVTVSNESDIAAACRRAAAWPTPTNGGPSLEAMDAVAATAICERATKDEPTNPDLVAYLARALAKGGRRKEAFDLLQAVSTTDSAAVQAYLGVMYEKGFGVEKNNVKAVYWYRLAAEHGHAAAQTNLGVMYANGGTGVIKDAAEAVRWYRKAAEQGDAHAENYLGSMYANGTGVAKDDTEAVRWYRMAAEQGYANAQNNLGSMYRDGTGVAKDDAEAVRWYRMAVEQGYAGAQDNLGAMYAAGTGVAKDEAEAVRWYRKAAEQGLADAQDRLGLMYNKGAGVAKDLVEAAHWFRKAAEQGDVGGQVNLAVMYNTGSGVPKDTSEGLRWLRKAADQGSAEAQLKLGLIYEYGLGIPKDPAEAARWYRGAAELGDMEAQTDLANLYFDGRGVVKDVAEAVRWYRKAADQGNAIAQFNLGTMYDTGIGVAGDQVEAAGLYRLAAQQGLADAQNNLGNLYAHGDGVAKDEFEAVRWYRKAAEQGDPAGQYNLGTMYQDGTGVANDDAEAARWFRKAAEQGNAQAQDRLGWQYKLGQGLAQDESEALQWIRRAAEQGDADAQLKLGVMFRNGVGVSKDDAEAVRWYRKSAEQGCSGAQYNLGLMYAAGTGVTKNDAEAIRWYRKAAEQNDTNSQVILGRRYENGRGVERDYVSAARFYIAAAHGGNDQGRTRIDHAYADVDDPLHAALIGNAGLAGELKSFAVDVGASYEESIFDCYSVLTDCGEAAWRRIDLAQAASWYRRAADSDAEAAFRLGRLLIAQPQLEQRQDEGMERLRSAAVAGNARARFYVNVLALPDNAQARAAGIAATLAGFEPQAAAELAFEAATGRFGDSAIGPAFQYMLDSSKGGAPAASIGLISVYGFYGDFEQAEKVTASLKDVHWFEISGWDYSIDHLLSFWLAAARKGYVPDAVQREGLRRLLTTLVGKQSTTAGPLLSKLDLLEDTLKRTPAVEASAEAQQSREALLSQIDRIGDRIDEKQKLGGLSPLMVRLYQRLADIQAELGQKDDAADSTLTALSIGSQINRDTRHLQGSLVYHLNQSCQLQQASEALYALERPETALLLAKSAVNELQDARTELVGLPQELQGCFRNLVSGEYRLLADLFIKQGHFVEAEWVLGQLKDYETYEFTREDPGLVQNAFEHIPLTPSQNDALSRITGLPLLDQYRLSRRMVELDQLDSLTEQQRTERAELDKELGQARTTFKDSLASLRASVKALETTRSEADQPPVQDLTDSGIRRLTGRLSDLPHATAYFYTVVLPDRVHILLSTKEGTEHIEIAVKEEELNAIIARARIDLQDRSKDPRPAAEVLYDLLWKPAESALQNLQVTDVVLSLDRQLRYIPFPALYDGKSYLIERYRFAVLTSSSQDQLLAEGTLGTLSAQALGASRGGQGFTPLANVVEEIDSIVKSANDNAGLLPGQRWLDDAFSKSGLSQALASDSPIIHVATHFSVGVSDDTTRMLLGTGDVLSLRDLRDGIVTGTFQFNRIRLLVLSACETAIGTGEELESLAAVMQDEGVRSVLATLWPVADQSTAAFMVRFYSDLSQGMSRAQALRATQLDFIHSAQEAPDAPASANDNLSPSLTAGVIASNQPLPPRFAHPRYWAPFTLMGQWR